MKVGERQHQIPTGNVTGQGQLNEESSEEMGHGWPSLGRFTSRLSVGRTINRLRKLNFGSDFPQSYALLGIDIDGFGLGSDE